MEGSTSWQHICTKVQTIEHQNLESQYQAEFSTYFHETEYYILPYANCTFPLWQVK